MVFIFKLCCLLFPVAQAQSDYTSRPCDFKCREKIQLEFVMKDILSKLGMSTPPSNNFTRPPQSFYDVYKTYKYHAIGNTNRSDILEFQLADPKEDELVTKTKLYVLIKYRRKKREGDRNRRAKDKREKQVVLTITKLSPNNSEEEFVKSLKLQIRKTELQEISLPTWVVEEAYKGNNRLLKLKVVCEQCNSRGGPQLVMLFKQNSVQRRSVDRKKKKKASRKISEKKSSRKYKRRPFLKIRTKKNNLFSQYLKT